MTRLPPALALCVLLTTAAAGVACATQPPAPVQSSADAADPRHVRLADTLRAGIDAEARGSEGADALLAAANRLSALGAQPGEGTADLAREWRGVAMAAGARPTAPPMRGRALGAAYSRGNLAAGARNATRQVFLAGQAASVTVVPLTEQSIDVAITAERKTTACARTATRPQATCKWTPSFTERYVIELANPGTQTADYFLIVN